MLVHRFAMVLGTMPCKRQDELRREALEILARISALTQEQLDAIKNRDDTKLLAADKKVEKAVGEKERTFGALREHRQEHGC